MFAILFIPVFTFFVENKDFFDTAFEQMEDGAEWHYVGPQKPDPKVKAISGRICKSNGECGEYYIMWKLKKGKQQ